MTSKLIVIGASAGGVGVLQRLVAELPPDLAAAVLVVLHVGVQRSRLPELLSTAGRLRATHARDGEALESARIYIAPPDQHMLVEGQRIRLTRTAKEHHTRPAIDPLFRSAALARRTAVIGMVLSGRLDDGTAGLLAIKAYGGIAVVQDPKEAEEPSMPHSALRHVAVDHCVPSSQLARLCVQLVGEPSKEGAAMPAPEVQHEHAIGLQQGDPVRHLDAIGTRSTFTCPDCHGTLWEISQGELTRYRCHTGHAFTLRTLLDTQSEVTDATLWSALRALNEKRRMLELLAATVAPGEDDMEGPRSELDSVEKHIAVVRGIVRENDDTEPVGVPQPEKRQ